VEFRSGEGESVGGERESVAGSQGARATRRSEGGGGIRSIEKGALILRCMRDAGGPLRLSDLARRAGMSRSMTHGYLVSLARAGLVEQDRDTGRYDLGEDALQLGLAALTRTDFMKVGRETLESLSVQTGETVVLSVWSEEGPVLVAKIDGRRPSIYEVRVGGVANLLVTATGLVFLAHKPAGGAAELIERARGRGLDGGFTAESLQATLAQIRRDGLATSRPTILPEASALAAPVFDHSGQMRAALTIIGPYGGLDTAGDGVNGAALREAARRLSRRLGAQTDDPSAAN
jgi:DNA-binding IclR family transcriptional regulator